MADRWRADLYADGWAEGVRVARWQILQADDLRDAVARLEALLEDDYRARHRRRKENA